MWILSFLPDSFLLFIVNLVLVVGIVSFVLFFFVINKVLRWFPALSSYYLVLQIASALLLVLGIYLKGGYSVEMIWRDRVTQLEEKLKVAEEKSQQVNKVVETKVVTQTKVVKEKGQEIIKYVDRPVIVEYEQKCPLPKEVIDVHNEATRMNLIVDQMNKEMKK
jgi:hypothetical protein